jgi:hypothetical protein
VGLDTHRVAKRGFAFDRSGLWLLLSQA